MSSRPMYKSYIHIMVNVGSIVPYAYRPLGVFYGKCVILFRIDSDVATYLT